MESLYKNIETDEIMTLDELRNDFYQFAKEDPRLYDNVSFNEYLNDALSKNGSLRVVKERCLVVGHTCLYRGELICKGFNKETDAYNFVNKNLNGKHAKVTIGSNVINYTTEDNFDTYEIHKIGNESFVLIDWYDDGGETGFDIAAFDVEDDAYRAVIDDMHSFLATNDEEETAVWFKNGEAGIDYGEAIYRWRIISI